MGRAEVRERRGTRRGYFCEPYTHPSFSRFLITFPHTRSTAPLSHIAYNPRSARLPTAKTAEAKAVRSGLFKAFGQGAPNPRSLSLGYIAQGLHKAMGARIFKKVVVQRAFDAARGKGGSQAAGSFSQKTLGFGELRYFLVYLRRYHELFSMFDARDESRDGRVAIDEFTKSLAALSEWGVDISDPEGEGRKGGGR